MRLIGCMCKRSDALSLAVLIGRGLDFAFLFFCLLSLFVQFSGCVLNMITFYESLKSGSFLFAKIMLLRLLKMQKMPMIPWAGDCLGVRG